MKQVDFEYNMTIKYTLPVSICHFTMKCIPQNNERQIIKGLELTLEPEYDYSQGEDSFGNQKIYGSLRVPHESFSIKMTGKAEFKQFLFEENANPEKISIFKYPYNLNRHGPRLVDYWEAIKPKKELNDYEISILIMNSTYEYMTYQPNVTGMATNAEEAFELGKGVCQDYAHIMIALCHIAGIPARYVTGLLEGEGASHAWVEVLWKDKWIGMDPTNNMVINYGHIKISHGRDASDCLINRGVMCGGGCQTQDIYVSVTSK